MKKKKNDKHERKPRNYKRRSDARERFIKDSDGRSTVYREEKFSWDHHWIYIFIYIYILKKKIIYS